MAPYQARTSSGSAPESPSASTITDVASGAVSALAQVGPAVGGHGVEQPVALGLDERGEALAHRPHPERPGERRPVAVVLRPVEREHAGADDLGGREALVVDGEGLVVAHHLQRERRGW